MAGTNKLSFDAGGADAAITSVIDLFTRYNATLAATSGNHVTLDKNGRVLRATIEALTASGAAFYVNLAKTKNGLEVVSTAAKAAESSLQRLQKQNERNAQAFKASTFIDTKTASLSGDVKVGDKLGLDRLAVQMTNLVRQGKLTASELENVYRIVEAGGKQTYKDPGFEAARQKAVRYRQELLKLNEAVGKSSKPTDNAGDRRERYAAAVGKRLNSSFETEKFDARGLQAYYNQVAKIQELIRRGGLEGGRFSTAFKAFNDGAGPLAGGEEKIRRSLVQIGNAFKDMEVRASKASVTMNQAFEIVKAQVLYNSLQHLTDEFSRMVTQAAEFQQQIALIQTISQDADLSFEEWSHGIAKVSDELGRPIADVAAAGYDALSNQVTKAAETFDFLRTSGQFARITNSSVKDSVDLLSSAINAFQIPTADAERVASSFFTTIDLGRIKAQELGGTFGRVAVFAHSLGISLEELGGAMSVISRQGIEAQTTQTLLNNVFQKLLNPTKQLQELYDKLGVGTGEAFVKTYGFIGALEKLKEAAGGSKDKIAEFFNEIRGFQGANTLIDRLDDLKKDVAEHLNSGSKVDVAKGLFAKNSGQQFVDEMNKITNYFRTEFETTVLETVLKLTNAVGGLSGIFKTVFGAITATLKTAAFAAGGFFATLGVAKIAQLLPILTDLNGVLLTASFGFSRLAAASAAFLASPIGIIATIGVGIGLWAKNAYDAAAAMDATVKSARELARAGIEAERNLFSQDLLSRRKAFEAGLNATQQAVLRLAQSARKELTSLGESQKKLGHDISESVQNGMELVLSDIKRIARELDALQKKAQENVKKAKQSIFDSFDDQQQEKFERAKKIVEVNRSNDQVSNGGRRAQFFDAEELSLYTTRVKQIDSLTKKAFAAGDIERGNALFKEKISLLSEAASIMKNVPVIGIDDAGNTQQVGQGQALRHLGIENQITEAFRHQRDLLKQQIALQEQKAETARKALAAEQERIKTLDSLAKDIHKFDPFTNEGELDTKKYKTIGAAIDELTAKQEQFLKVAGASQDPHATVATLRTFREQKKELEDLFKQQRGNVSGQLDTHKKVTQLDELRDAALQAPNKALESFDALGRRAGEAEEKILRTRAAMKELFFILGGNVHDKNQGFFKDPQGLNTKAIAAIKTAYESFDKSLQSGNVKQAEVDLDNYIAKLKEAKLFNAPAVQGNETRPGQTAGQVTSTLKAFFAELQSAQTAKAGTVSILEKFVQDSQKIDPVVQQVQEKFKELGIKGAESIGPVNTAIGQTTTGLEGMINKLDAAARAWEALNQAAKSQGASAPATGVVEPSVDHKSMGGYVGHLAAGGLNPGFMSDFWSGAFAKGTDVVPTMLGREEIVMNSRASAKFAPQLQALNRGQTPQVSSKPGSSSVVNVHTTVNVAKAGNDDINRIVAGINRAQRRGQLSVTKG